MQASGKQYDNIIIGSGLGGLTAGALLAKAGHKVLLLEQHYLPGGCATTYHRKGFKIEVGLHEMDGLDELDPKVAIFRELAIFEHLDFIRLPEFYRLKSKRFDLVLPHSIKRAKRTLTQAFPNEQAAIDCFFKTITDIRTQALKFQKLGWKGKLLKPFVPLFMPTLFRYRKRSLGHFLDAITRNEDLKIVLAANFGYYHHDPHTLSLLYFGMAQASYFAGGYFIKGGSQNLSNYLVDYIKQKGGTVLLRRTVTRILTKGNRAIGVQYQATHRSDQSSQTAYARTIIANSAIPNLPALLTPKPAARLLRQFRHCQNSCSLMPIYLCFNRSVKKLGHRHYNTFLLADHIDKLSDLKTSPKLPCAERSLAFIDYSQIDSDLAPEGKSFGTLCSIDFAESWEGYSISEYEQRKTKIANAMLQRLERLIPGINQAIEHIEIGTPKTIERFTQNPGGAVYGFAQTPDQAGQNRVGCVSKIKNLLFASAWTFPGGGYTGAIIAGDYCARVAMRNHKI